MQDLLRSRIEQLKEQKRQGEFLVKNAEREVTILTGALQEATACLNHLISEEKKAKEAQEKEAAKKSKAKAKKKTVAPVKEVTENTVTPDSENASLAA